MLEQGLNLPQPVVLRLVVLGLYALYYWGLFTIYILGEWALAMHDAEVAKWWFMLDPCLKASALTFILKAVEL